MRRSRAKRRNSSALARHGPSKMSAGCAAGSAAAQDVALAEDDDSVPTVAAMAEASGESTGTTRATHVGQAEVVPEPRTERAGTSGSREPAESVVATVETKDKQPKPLPYDDPVYVALHLQAKTTSDDLDRLATFLLKHMRKNDPARPAQVLELADAADEAVETVK
jgi:hypothetical protein